MENFILPRDVRDALVNYLAVKPWQEVQEVMPVLLNLQPAAVPAPPTASAEGIDLVEVAG